MSTVLVILDSANFMELAEKRKAGSILGHRFAVFFGVV
jgi:hypothetical protein